MGLRNLESTSVLRSGGRRECRQLSRESIFLKKESQNVNTRTLKNLNNMRYSKCQQDSNTVRYSNI